MGVGNPRPSAPFFLLTDIIRCWEVDGPLFDRLDAKKRAPITAIPTPYRRWNIQCRDEGGGVGLARGWYIVYGAKTGTGKSIMGINLAVKAFREGHKVAYVSLEMSLEQLMTRAMAVFSGISVVRLEHGKEYAPADADTVKTDWLGWAERHHGSLWLNKDPVSHIEDLLAIMRDMIVVQGCTFLVVDYIQLVWTGNAANILDRITEVSNGVRAMTKEHNVVTVGLSQFHRQGSRSDTSPVPTDLMGGSPLENDADQVLLLDHTSYDAYDAGDKLRYTVLLAKNRHGSCGEIPVVFDKKTLRITERAND